MEGISDICIIGFDPTRPPRILEQPYINLFFELSHKAPEDWCKAFNDLTRKTKYSINIEEATGLHIATWVRKPEEIEDVLDFLKEKVNQCNDEYIEGIRQRANTVKDGDGDQVVSGPQGELNRIVAGLQFDN